MMSETIRLRAPHVLVAAAETHANNRGESISGMIRRLISAEVPDLPAGMEGPPPSDAASLLADILAGDAGAPFRLRQVIRLGSAEDKDRLLRALAGYFLWEYRVPLDAAGVAELISETDQLLARAD